MGRFTSILSVAGACGALLGTTCVAHAQQADDASRSAARDIGTAGVNAFQHDDFATASSKLEKAYQVLKVPSLGLWSARALVKLGKLVQASERYREVLRLDVSEGDLAVQKQAQADASAELNTLTPKIPGIVIQLDGSPAGVSLSVDGAAVSAALLGERRPVDPGKHVVEARRGSEQARAEVTVAEGESKPVALAFGASAAAPASAAAVPSAQGGPPAASAAESPSGLGTQKTIAIVAGGVGVVGVALGTVFGLQSKSKHDQAMNLNCAGATCPDASGLSASRDAVKAGNLSTIAFVVGAAGLAGGAALWFTAKSSDSGSAQLGLGVGTIQMRGTW